MAGYIYQVTEQVDKESNDWQTRLQTTRKYEATKFLEKQLAEGISLSEFEVTRSRDGRIDSMVIVDTYEFMNVDLGEV